MVQDLTLAKPQAIELPFGTLSAERARRKEHYQWLQNKSARANPSALEFCPCITVPFRWIKRKDFGPFEVRPQLPCGEGSTASPTTRHLRAAGPAADTHSGYRMRQFAPPAFPGSTPIAQSRSEHTRKFCRRNRCTAPLVSTGGDLAALGMPSNVAASRCTPAPAPHPQPHGIRGPGGRPRVPVEVVIT
jgi:hypothetical protein